VLQFHLSFQGFPCTGNYPLYALSQEFSQIIKVSSSLRSLTLQAQAQASPSLLYSPSGDPSCPAKVFSHRKNFRDSIESYSRGVPRTCSAPSGWCYLNTIFISSDHDSSQSFHGSVVIMFIIFSFDSLHLFPSEHVFSSHLYHRYTTFMRHHY
jgi:hypothetical protein